MVWRSLYICHIHFQRRGGRVGHLKQHILLGEEGRKGSPGSSFHSLSWWDEGFDSLIQHLEKDRAEQKASPPPAPYSPAVTNRQIINKSRPSISLVPDALKQLLCCMCPLANVCALWLRSEVVRSLQKGKGCSKVSAHRCSQEWKKLALNKNGGQEVGGLYCGC